MLWETTEDVYLRARCNEEPRNMLKARVCISSGGDELATEPVMVNEDADITRTTRGLLSM